MRNAALVGLSVLMTLTACGHHVRPQPPTSVEHHTYYDVRSDGPDTFTVAAQRGLGEAEAKEDICTSTYICVRQEIPIVIYQLQRTRK